MGVDACCDFYGGCAGAFLVVFVGACCWGGAEHVGGDGADWGVGALAWDEAEEFFAE